MGIKTRIGIDKEIDVLKKAGGLPGHIAIIMDGNGRWAKKRNMPRIAGHRAGRESVKEKFAPKTMVDTIETCKNLRKYRDTGSFPLHLLT